MAMRVAKRFLVLGKNGQVGRALASLLGEQALALDRVGIDLADSAFISALEPVIASQPWAAVINATAYTQVDLAEGEGRELALRVNVQAVGELASLCRRYNLPLLHYSTDYVFDGGGRRPWRETDAAHPLNQYGRSKEAGEQAIRRSGVVHLILRTSWIYDAQGKNFFTTMLRLFGEKEMLSIVADQIGAPTYAKHLAQASVAVLERALAMPVFPGGTLHLCARGETSWHGFADAILALARTRLSGQDSPPLCQRLIPVSSRDYPAPAVRPLNSRLDCAKARELFGVALPDWEQGVSECLEEYARNRLPDSRP